MPLAEATAAAPPFVRFLPPEGFATFLVGFSVLRRGATIMVDVGVDAVVLLVVVVAVDGSVVGSGPSSMTCSSESNSSRVSSKASSAAVGAGVVVVVVVVLVDVIRFKPPDFVGRRVVETPGRNDNRFVI